MPGRSATSQPLFECSESEVFMYDDFDSLDEVGEKNVPA